MFIAVSEYERCIAERSECIGAAERERLRVEGDWSSSNGKKLLKAALITVK